MRNSRHDNSIHACHLNDDGITVGDKLDGLTGMLGWSVLRDCPTTTGHDETTAT